MFWQRFLPMLNEAFMIASALSLLAGWHHIRRQRVETHRRYMLLASALGAAFFVSYVVRTVVVGETSFGGPARWHLAYLTFLQVHTVLATVAGVLGIVTLRLAFGGRFARHRRVAPWTASLWIVSAATGLAVYLLLYVVYPPGPTTDIWRAILR